MYLIETLNEFLWSYVLIIVLAGCAIYFTCSLKGLQFTHLCDMCRQMTASSDARVGGFQAFAIAMASRVGTGNLAGVASAIFIGGPGAVFWMWIMALLGAASAFVEATLAQLYKQRGVEAYYGGPAFYMWRGLHSRWMGLAFVVLITLTFSVGNQLVQITTLCDALCDTATQLWSIQLSSDMLRAVVALILTITTLFIVWGGVVRISRFSAMVVPIMAVGYVALSIVIIGMHIAEIPAVLSLIVKSAFGIDQVAGGTLGMTIVMGVRRGLFSNEAGEGSTPNAAAVAETSHPVKQGLLQSLGVYVDTIVICSCTAFVILLAGLYQGDTDGILLTSISLQYLVGPWGRYFLTVAIFLFSYSTLIGNYFYGENNLHFITRRRWVFWLFRLLTAVVLMGGAFLTLEQAFTLVDICMAFMTLLNLGAIVALFPKVRILLEDYKAQRRDGQDPTFHKTILPADVQKDIECWN